ESFEAHDARELLHGLAGLAPKFWPYVLSFYVLGVRWLSNVEVRSHGEVYGREYARWWLLYLLLITCVPLTTIIVGRFGNMAPAIWLYAGNTILISAVAFRMTALTPEIEQGEPLRRRRLSLIVLMGSSALAIAWSLIETHYALWAMALNVAVPVMTRWGRQPK
ncbi:MAG: DUF1211 domain-containing protein, partial [Xanthobacteraceae bacterium]|nr:DUF1211 domain-containing protein [Xanthobacteraceae bacterium]